MTRADRFTARPGFIGTITLAAVIAAAASVLAGCADLRAAVNLQPLPVNPASPVAAEAIAAGNISASIPPFTAIPPKPTDVRPVAAYKSAVIDVVGERRTFVRWIAANPPIIDNTDAYAASQRSRVSGEKPVDAQRQAEADAFAAKLRASAKTPPKTPN
jgi:hypothetical protein